MIVLIGDVESVCDIKECSDSYSTVVIWLRLPPCASAIFKQAWYCSRLGVGWQIMRSRRCKDYKNNFAHLLKRLDAPHLYGAGSVRLSALYAGGGAAWGEAGASRFCTLSAACADLCDVVFHVLQDRPEGTAATSLAPVVDPDTVGGGNHRGVVVSELPWLSVVAIDGTGDRSVSRLDSFDSFYPWLKKA